jgi:hypothetical protein
MARHSGQVQLQQADIGIALNMIHMANQGILHSNIEDTIPLMKNLLAEIQEQIRYRVGCPGLSCVKAVIGKHPAMLYEHKLDDCLSYNESIGNFCTCWICNGT